MTKICHNTWNWLIQIPHFGSKLFSLLSRHDIQQIDKHHHFALQFSGGPFSKKKMTHFLKIMLGIIQDIVHAFFFSSGFPSIKLLNYMMGRYPIDMVHRWNRPIIVWNIINLCLVDVSNRTKNKPNSVSIMDRGFCCLMVNESLILSVLYESCIVFSELNCTIFCTLCKRLWVQFPRQYILLFQKRGFFFPSKKSFCVGPLPGEK